MHPRVARIAVFAGAVLLTLGGVAAPAAAAAPAPITAPVTTVVAEDLSAPGSYPVGNTDAAVNAAGRSFNARIYYPATSAGSGTPVAAGAFPAIAFGHGFLQNVSRYASTNRHLASWGFITILPTSQGGLFPSHGAFADDLNAALTWLVAQHSTPGSRFAEHVRVDRLGLSGHSMGGGASILAAARNPAVRTVSNLAAAETNPSAVAAAGTLTIPVQLIGGSRDSTAGVAQHQRPIYQAKPAPKQLRVIVGGYHCGFMDSNSLFCDSGSISRAIQLQITRQLLTAWFLYYLAGQTDRYDLVWGPPARTDPQVTFEGQE